MLLILLKDRVQKDASEPTGMNRAVIKNAGEVGYSGRRYPLVVAQNMADTTDTYGQNKTA